MARSRPRDLVRRSIGAVIVAALLGAAAAVGAGFTGPGSVASPVVDGPPTLPVRTISPVPTTSPTPTTSSTPIPGGDGGGAEQPGIVIRARPASDGTFLVSETITLPGAATEVVLRPPSVRDAGTGFERLAPAAAEVEASAAGQPLAVPDGPVRDEVVLHWDDPTVALQLRYRLTGVSVLSRPARAGRSLAAFGSVLDRQPADLPVTVEVSGRTVLSLTCPQLPLDQLSCGAGIAPKFWTVRPIPYDRSQVLVQYDRPAGR